VLGDADLVAFVASCDLEEAGRFYGEVLGFPLLEASEFASAYDVNGTLLRVTLSATSYRFSNHRRSEQRSFKRVLTFQASD
jgi:catechol 2,3-dioxygenase-like lactoylglutathione lyase family enzyme